MLEQNDKQYILGRGMDVATVERQIERFVNGFPYLQIIRPASVGDGIVRLGGQELTAFGNYYDSRAVSTRAVKFVPASGAATRMFKDLFAFLGSGETNRTVDEVLASLEDFAFYDSLRPMLPEDASVRDVIERIVGSGGLGYGDKPKALILFHRYAHEVRTALEEHLVEGAEYAACGGRVAIHFTVSPEHRAGFDALLERVLTKYGDRYGVRYDIAMSEQKSSTDTIAVNPDNTPFRNGDGSLLFRPAGHGALIENLNELDADIIFIKNIDNVTTDSRRGDTVLYKKALAGMLMRTRDEAYAYMRMLGEGVPSKELADDIASFVRNTLNVELPEGFDGMDASARGEVLRRVLDRPMRVCGMVRNEGEPGGGPFFARSGDGFVSLQIVESSQIAPDRRDVMRGATHFNPVDLVCSTKDYRGRKYDLSRFVDHATGFISEKSKDGRPLKALELPGLWNGAMSSWNTIFVEVPVTTFTPVKVVTDLLRSGHRE